MEVPAVTIVGAAITLPVTISIVVAAVAVVTPIRSVISAVIATIRPVVPTIRAVIPVLVTAVIASVRPVIPTLVTAVVAAIRSLVPTLRAAIRLRLVLLRLVGSTALGAHTMVASLGFLGVLVLGADPVLTGISWHGKGRRHGHEGGKTQQRAASGQTRPSMKREAPGGRRICRAVSGLGHASFLLPWLQASSVPASRESRKRAWCRSGPAPWARSPQRSVDQGSQSVLISGHTTG